jgi:hypothetical protein
VPWRPSAAPRWPVGARRRIRVEDAVVADAAENLDASAGEVVTDGNRVIAGVEHEQRHLAVEVAVQALLAPLVGDVLDCAGL